MKLQGNRNWNKSSFSLPTLWRWLNIVEIYVLKIPQRVSIFNTLQFLSASFKGYVAANWLISDRDRWRWFFQKQHHSSTTLPCKPWTRSVQSTKPKAGWCFDFFVCLWEDAKIWRTDPEWTCLGQKSIQAPVLSSCRCKTVGVDLFTFWCRWNVRHFFAGTLLIFFLEVCLHLHIWLCIWLYVYDCVCICVHIHAKEFTTSIRRNIPVACAIR